MNISSIPQNEHIIIDSNIFVYANHCYSDECVRLLHRCAKGDVTAVITTNILSEVMHVLMLAEARDIGLISGSNPAKQLSKSPNVVMSLNRYETHIRDLLSIGLILEPLQREDFITAMNIQRQYGLLTNDALFLAVSIRLRIFSIVSADSMFGKVRGIKHYTPEDLASN